MATSYFKNWAAYRKGFLFAREIEALVIRWPDRERYLLASQIRRSSRSVCSSLGESFAKRDYPKHFTAKLSDAAMENYETQVWLDFAVDLGYIDKDRYASLLTTSEEIGKLLTYMQKNPKKY